MKCLSYKKKQLLESFSFLNKGTNNQRTLIHKGNILIFICNLLKNFQMSHVDTFLNILVHLDVRQRLLV